MTICLNSLKAYNISEIKFFGVVNMSKNILSVFKLNKNGTLAVVIPAKEARELGITEKSCLSINKMGNSLHYNPVVIE